MEKTFRLARGHLFNCRVQRVDFHRFVTYGHV